MFRILRIFKKVIRPSRSEIKGRIDALFSEFADLNVSWVFMGDRICEDGVDRRAIRTVDGDCPLRAWNREKIGKEVMPTPIELGITDEVKYSIILAADGTNNHFRSRILSATGLG